MNLKFILVSLALLVVVAFASESAVDEILDSSVVTQERVEEAEAAAALEEILAMAEETKSSKFRPKVLKRKSTSPKKGPKSAVKPVTAVKVLATPKPKAKKPTKAPVAPTAPVKKLVAVKKPSPKPYVTPKPYVKPKPTVNTTQLEQLELEPVALPTKKPRKLRKGEQAKKVKLPRAKHVGCYKDGGYPVGDCTMTGKRSGACKRQARIFPTRQKKKIGGFFNLDNFGTIDSAVVQCQKLALKQHHNTFALQNKNECWTGSHVNYARYGKEKSTEQCGKTGGAYTNQVKCEQSAVCLYV